MAVIEHRCYIQYTFMKLRQYTTVKQKISNFVKKLSQIRETKLAIIVL